ncbi:MAG TPA: hypothetical protein VHX59_14855 [Mycobacteriales bacterium]|nr:hypothetical protein [Mycobacteriales bacterium]
MQSTPDDIVGRGIRRRSFLGAAGVSVLAAAAGGTIGAGGGSTPAGAAEPPAAGDLPLVGGTEFPIGLFWPPPPYETTQARYQEIADAGFTFVISGNYLLDPYINNYAMKWCDLTGLKYLVADDPNLSVLHTFKITEQGTGTLEMTEAEAQKVIGSMIASFTAHPSFAGISFWDEPNASELPNVADSFNLFRAARPDLLPYTNLERGISENPTQLANFVQQVQPSLISFDHYPLFVDSTDQTWFQDWADVRAAGLASGLPTWTYILSVQHLNYRSPTTADMLWQVNVSLAYGCKGIQYFTYWTPEAARGQGFSAGAGALIAMDGTRTERYDGAQWINTQWLSRVGKQLKPLVSESIGLANPAVTPPAGLPAFQGDTIVQSTSGNPVIVSRFSNRADTAHQWVFVANYSLDTKAAAAITFGAAVRANGIARFDPVTEKYRSAGARGRRVTVALEPGAAALFQVETTA